ncbi:hypothetical protein GGR50DRAFT_388771 [Xylaria sp. CBS 124048]|nr:hypothetical protein GGR50DRAFT_388771 [Xylaria sp. CBS 124048]
MREGYETRREDLEPQFGLKESKKENCWGMRPRRKRQLDTAVSSVPSYGRLPPPGDGNRLEWDVKEKPSARWRGAREYKSDVMLDMF